MLKIQSNAINGEKKNAFCWLLKKKNSLQHTSNHNTRVKTSQETVKKAAS